MNYTTKEKALALTYALAVMRGQLEVAAPDHVVTIQRHIYALIELVASCQPDKAPS